MPAHVVVAFTLYATKGVIPPAFSRTTGRATSTFHSSACEMNGVDLWTTSSVTMLVYKSNNVFEMMRTSRAYVENN